MVSLNVTDVRALPGDSAFLIDDGKTSILYDTGFGFTGYRIADNIQKVLGDRPLDYIFLSHSHYDHVLGAPYILRRYPNATVVAGAYAEKIFQKPTARAVMRDLDRKYAATCGVQEYDDLVDELKVDIVVEDGDTVTCGDMTFTTVNLPGHTKCSVAFYLNENRLLLGSETLGVYFGNNTYLPFYLVGFQMTLDSFAKARTLDIESILLPHYGVVNHDEAAVYLENSEKVTRDTAAIIQRMIREGATDEEILEHFTTLFYTDTVKPTYPRDAFNLNTGILIRQIRNEF